MKLFVWDFHGVLEKGNEFAVRHTTNLILARYKYKRRLTADECQKLYGRKWYEYFKYLLPDEVQEKYFELQDACRRYSIDHPNVIANHIKPNNYSHMVIRQIAKSHDQIIISNSHPEALEMFVKSVRLERYFPLNKIFGAGTHDRKSLTTKKGLLEAYLEGKDFTEIIYIGDSPEDVELSKFFKGKTYLYAHPKKEHKKARADYRINDLRKILKEI